MAALLACMLLVPVSAGAEKLYGEANRNNVPMMNTTGENAWEVFTIDKGDEFEIVEPVMVDGAIAWYKVYCTHPENGSTYQVFVRAEYVTPVVDGGNEEPKDEVTMKPSGDSELD